MRLGVLYPPCGAEWEYYRHCEPMAPGLRVTLVGVRIYGGDDEHAPGHMVRTASLENLKLSADALAPLAPDAAVWACTSGSFVSGLAHARQQAGILGRRLDCPVTSASLAFIEALNHLGIRRVSVLASYPRGMGETFTSFLGEAGIEVDTMASLDFESGPASARIGDDRLLDRAGRMSVPGDGALLVPDTAIPTLHLLPQLQAAHGVPVLTANQVSIWHLARLAGLHPSAQVAGSLAESE